MHMYTAASYTLFYEIWVELFTPLSVFQEGLKEWAHQIENGVCLFDRKKLPEDSDLTDGQV